MGKLFKIFAIINESRRLHLKCNNPVVCLYNYFHELANMVVITNCFVFHTLTRN